MDSADLILCEIIDEISEASSDNWTRDKIVDFLQTYLTEGDEG